MKIHFPALRQKPKPTQPVLNDICNELRRINKNIVSIERFLIMWNAKNATVPEKVILTESMRERVKEIFSLSLPCIRWMEAILFLNEHQKNPVLQQLLFDAYIEEYHKNAKDLRKAERHFRHDFEAFGYIVRNKDHVRTHVYHLSMLMMEEAKKRILGYFNALNDAKEQMVCMYTALNRFSYQMSSALGEADDTDDDDDDLDFFMEDQDEEDEEDCDQEEGHKIIPPSPAQEDPDEMLSPEERDEIAEDLRRRINVILREMQDDEAHHGP